MDRPGSDATGLSEDVRAVNALSASWARSHTDGNTAMSAAGCWVLLAVLAAAAEGPARRELVDAVGIAGARALDAVEALHGALADMPGVAAALGLWSRVVLDPAFVEQLPDDMVGQLSGAPAADQQRLDAWVAQATDGRLETLPVALDEDSLLVLASALTVHTRWAEPFAERSEFVSGPWAGGGMRLTSSTVDLDRVRVAPSEVGPLTLLCVPGTENVNVHLLRGAPDATPGAVLAAGVEAVTGDRGRSGSELAEGEPAAGLRVETVSAAAPEDRLSLETPAFVVHGSHDLLATKDLFGLQTASDARRGHFPRLSAEPLAVRQARQDVVAEFSKDGFEAAAATAVDVMAGSAPAQQQHESRRITASFDHPFGFVAVHEPSQLVLVAGWVQDPR